MALTKIPSSLLDTSGGFDLQGNITLGDNEQIQLGADGDLAIYHDGSHSYIKDTGTGNLFIDATSLRLRTGAGTENYLVAEGNGAVTLYHDNSPKIATTSTGATVTGTLTVTGDLDITGNVNSYNVTDLDVTDQTITLGAGQTEANSGGSGIIIDGSSASILWNETDSVFDFNKDISLDNGLFFSSQDFYLYRSAADVATLRVGDDGSYKYFQFTDTGTVARFNSASGAVSLGSGANDHLLINSSGLVMIGTSTPSGLLNVDGNLHYGGQLRVNDPSHDGTESNPSICVGYDNDNGFFRPASNTIAMTTAGTEKMRITATGNVGIGTDSPDELLHLSGGTNCILKLDTRDTILSLNQELGVVQFYQNDSTAGGTGVGAKIRGRSTYRASNPTYFGNGMALDFNISGDAVNSNADVTAMSIIPGGNVGIGTSSPTKSLSVKAPSGSNGGIDVFHNNGNKVAELVHHGSGDEGRLSLYDGGTSTVQLHGETGQNSYINSGNVGIGETSPDNILHIKTTASGGPQIQIGDGTNYGFINFDGTSMQISTQRDMVDGTWYNTSKSWGGINIVGESIGSKITMATAGNSNTAPTTHFLLDRDGHFILGSSTTQAGKLSVYTDATNDSAIYGYRSTSYFRIVPFLSNGAFSSLSSVDDSGLFFSDNFVIAKHATGDFGMKVFGNGNVSFGTGTAASKYTFQGTTTGDIITVKSGNNTNTNVGMILFRDSGNTYCGQITANGSTHTTAYLTSSDYRLKENISYEFNALDRVAQLRPARFNWINDDTNTLVDGFLAHEVSNIVPEAINGEKDATKEEEYEVTPAQYEDDGETLISEAVMGTRTVPVYQGIDQSKLVPLLTKAIQELSAKLEAAEARITELEG